MFGKQGVTIFRTALGGTVTANCHSPELTYPDESLWVLNVLLRVFKISLSFAHSRDLR